ncbi:MAG: serine/threonine protein kinase [Gemmatimonadaceae bacterium]|nr:serine/threonine protein kinase [Gemmatimonadaceae bacterium]
MTSLPAPQPADPTIPDAVRTAFDIVRPLGQGGMGSVWLARDRLLDRLVAIKVLLTGTASDATRERFLREARTAAKLSHPHIVPVHRADEANGQVWFSMGFVEGESLGDRIRERGALPVADVVRLLRETAWALAYAHARGVIHRDVKPDNIMIERDTGRAMVTDFGIARDLRTAEARLTADGSVLGTVFYMSPEQASDDPLDARSDVYSLGVVGFHALSNRLPFEGSPNAVLVSHVTKAAPSLRSVSPMVPGPIAAVIDKCLAKEPGSRWDSAEALADALGKALDEVVTAERGAVAATGGEVISERDAAAVWQRAAQLQAEAARRMEKSVHLAAPADGSATVPTDTYRVRDVEAAAVEAGISRQFVAIALAERTAAASHGAVAVAALSDRDERRLTLMFGTSDRSISASRTLRVSPKVALQLIGRVFTATPFHLKVRETVNGHPLDGGILRFDVPNLYQAMSDGRVGSGGFSRNGALMYRCAQLEIGVLNVTLKARGTAAAPECEVVVTGDLRAGYRKQLKAITWSAIGSGGGFFGAAIGIGTKVLGGLALASLPALAIGGLVGVGAMYGYRAILRKAMHKGQEELDTMLLALQQSFESQALFGELPAPASANRRDGDDAAMLAAVVTVVT